jgi:hypothetical protein
VKIRCYVFWNFTSNILQYFRPAFRVLQLKVGCWYHQAAGIIRLLVSSGCWYHQAAGILRLLVSSEAWYPQAAGILRGLVSSGCWYPQAAGIIRLLVSSGCWYHQAAGVIRLLVSSGCWYHQAAGILRLLVSSGCWCHQVAGIIRGLVLSRHIGFPRSNKLALQSRTDQLLVLSALQQTVCSLFSFRLRSRWKYTKLQFVPNFCMAVKLDLPLSGER